MASWAQWLKFTEYHGAATLKYFFIKSSKLELRVRIGYQKSSAHWHEA